METHEEGVPALTHPALLLEAARRFGDRVAIREKDLGLWQEITWAEYLDHVRRFALGLVKLGMREGDRVAILSENCQEWLYSDLGTQCAGGVVVTAYPTSSVEALRHIVTDSGARFIVAGDQEQADKALAILAEGGPVEALVVFDRKGVKTDPGGRVLFFQDVQALGEELRSEQPGLFERMARAVQPDDLYDIMYTSGTTGLPKGAMCNQKAPIQGAVALRDALAARADDSWLSYLPLSHAFERALALSMHLCTGYAVSFAESIDSVQADLAEVQPTLFGAVPRILEKIKTSVEIRVNKTTGLKRWAYQAGMRRGARLAKAQRIDTGALKPAAPGQVVTRCEIPPRRTGSPFLQRCFSAFWYLALWRPIQRQLGFVNARWILVGGAPIGEEVLDFLHALGLPVSNIFGMTELHNVVSFSPPNEMATGTVGRVIRGWKVRKNPEGEISFAGPIGFRGYFGSNDATLHAFSDGWLNTGDLGEVYEDGSIAIHGRLKDIIITSGGKNISPQFLENALRASPYVSEAIVIGDGRKFVSVLIEIEEAAVGEYLRLQGIAYTTVRDMAANPAVRDLIAGEIAQTNQRVSHAEAIKKFRILPKDLSHEDEEMTPTRKVKRRILERKFKALIDEMYSEPADAGRESARA